jgi:hypothetical protein
MPFAYFTRLTTIDNQYANKLPLSPRITANGKNIRQRNTINNNPNTKMVFINHVSNTLNNVAGFVTISVCLIITNNTYELANNPTAAPASTDHAQRLSSASHITNVEAITHPDCQINIRSACCTGFNFGSTRSKRSSPIGQQKTSSQRGRPTSGEGQ